MSDSAETLVATLVSSDRDDSGATYRLLQLLFEGASRQYLRVLLDSRRELARHAAAWILTELGGAPEFYDDVAVLLEDSDPVLRYYGIELVMLGAADIEPQLLARAVDCVADSDGRVALRAMQMVAATGTSQLERSSPYCHGPDFPVLVRWLVAPRPDAVDEVAETLARGSALEQRFAAIRCRRFQSLCGALPMALEAPDHVTRLYAAREIQATGSRAKLGSNDGEVI